MRVRLGILLLAMATTGCTYVISHRGKPATMPPSVKWCSEATRRLARQALPRELDEGRQCNGGDVFCTHSAEVLRPCAQRLTEDISSPRGAKIRGSFIMGLSTDERGRLTDLCLADSDLGDTPVTLDCVAQVVSDVAGLAPNLSEARWDVHWFLD